MKTATAVILGAAPALVIGLWSGAASAGEPITRTPSACHEMADTAMDAFQLWADLADATRERGDALDAEARAVGDGEVNHLLASLDVIAPKYDAEVVACLGDS